MDGSARSAHSWSDTVMDCQLVCDDHLLCQVETYLFFVFFQRASDTADSKYPKVSVSGPGTNAPTKEQRYSHY